MTGIATELLIILLLLLVNGVFAMSEIAVVTARRSQLQARAEEGDVGARRALELAESPNRFLSTVQIGISAVGVLAGAFGGATVARTLADWLAGFPRLAPYADALGLALVVLGITYLALVIGELVPKRLALHSPERIASAVAGPMRTLSVIGAPLVELLSVSTEAVLRLLRVREPEEAPVTDEEIVVLLKQGTRAGVFDRAEQDLVERVFWLGDQEVSSLMTQRHRIAWLDLKDPSERHRQMMQENPQNRYILCEGGLDNVVGMVATKDLWAASLRGEALDLRASAREPLCVPRNARALRVLEMFRDTGVHLALVVDEYGHVKGLVTLTDLVEEIVGELAAMEGAPAGAVQREDGSWLMDGSLAMADAKRVLGIERRPAGEEGAYTTLGGFVLTRMGRVPQPADHFEWSGLRFEVVDMDGRRVDKVLVQRTPAALPEAPATN
jgi:putative hemolysin